MVNEHSAPPRHWSLDPIVTEEWTLDDEWFEAHPDECDYIRQSLPNEWPAEGLVLVSKVSAETHTRTLVADISDPDTLGLACNVDDYLGLLPERHRPGVQRIRERERAEADAAFDAWEESEAVMWIPPGMPESTEEISSDGSNGRDETVIEKRPPVLPEEFWSARPVLAHIRVAARARSIAPDALFGAVVARALLLTDYRFVLPAVVARIGSLNLLVNLVGPSGTGKGAGVDESRRLLPETMPIPDFVVAEIPLGSGEGMVRVFFTERTVPNDTGRGSHKETAQCLQGVLVRVDEGQTMTKLGERSGQTTMQTLRQAFSGETLGGAYVTSPSLPAHCYRLCLLMGVQPELAGFLFADDEVAGGTPQRMIWLATVDPGATLERPAHPGPILWRPLSIHDPAIAPRAENLAGIGKRWALGVHPAIATELELEKWQRLRGDLPTNPLEAHAGLLKLKVGAALAVLDGRADIDESDWHLAGMVMATSRQVRRWTEKRVKAVAIVQANAADYRAEIRAERETVARTMAETGIARVAATLSRHVRRHAGEVDGCRTRCLARAVESRDRAVIGAALGVALERGWILEADDGRYQPGVTQPPGSRE